MNQDQPGHDRTDQDRTRQDQQAAEFVITKGEPTDEEVAAVVAVLSARSAAVPAQSAEKPRPAWATYWRHAKVPHRPGPGSWQAAVRNW